MTPERWTEADTKRSIVFRKVFSGPEGMAVLRDILTDLGYWNMHASGEGQMALRNYALLLCYKLGFHVNLDNFTQKLLEIPVEYAKLNQNQSGDGREENE